MSLTAKVRWVKTFYQAGELYLDRHRCWI